MTSPPHIVPENNQDIILDVTEIWSGCQKVRDNVTREERVRCEATRTFRSSRERWWYLAVSRCQNSTISVSRWLCVVKDINAMKLEHTIREDYVSYVPHVVPSIL